MTPLLLLLLFCLSLLPPAYLRYYPFRHIAGPEIKKYLAAGSFLIFGLELALLGGGVESGLFQVTPESLQWLYNFAYLPYELLLMGLLRHYFFQHLFILGVQGIYMYLIHCLCAALVIFFFGPIFSANRMGFYLSLYLLLFMGGFFPMLKFMDWAVPEQVLQQPDRIWRYLGPVPILLVYYQANMVQVGRVSLGPELWVPRLLMGVLGGLLSLLLQRGILRLQRNVHLQQKNIRLSRQLDGMQQAVDLLRKEQQEQSIIRHDTRHQLRIVGELTGQEKWADAEAFLEKEQK